MGVTPATLRIELGRAVLSDIYDWPVIAAEYPHLLEKRCRSDEEFVECLDRITGWLIVHRAHIAEVCLETREKELSPPTKMTLAEIEKTLGYRVEIVTEK